MSERPVNFVLNVRSQLEERRWSAPELARKSGLSPKTVNNILNSRHAPRQDIQRAIAEGFGLELWQLWLPSLPKDVAHDDTFPRLVKAAAKLDTKAMGRIAYQVELETLKAKTESPEK